MEVYDPTVDQPQIRDLQDLNMLIFYKVTLKPGQYFL
jgi:hypothetical protein